MELNELKNKYAEFIASLPDDLKAKVDECKTVEELNELLDDYDGELPDDIAEAVAGGKGGPSEPKLTDLPCWCKMKSTIQPGDGKKPTWTKAGSLVWAELSYSGYMGSAMFRIFPSNTDKSEFIDTYPQMLLFERK